MKKFLSIFLAIALMIPSFLSLSVSAEENNLCNDDYFVALAKKTFPEYADKINVKSDQTNSTRSLNSEPQIAIRDTRTVDSNTIMTYTEYDNGIVTLGALRFTVNKDIEIEEEISYSNYTQYTATLVAKVEQGPPFTATNVQYKIYPTSYDQITSLGNYSIPGYSSSQFSVSLRSNETATRSACAYYAFPCPVGLSDYRGEVLFEIINNSTYLNVYIY